MKSAQLEYLVKYSVDICSIWSTSTLSLKIFRQKFLKKDIPILTKSCDSFVRRGYYGGATDYYHLQGENLYYYDVNSLYPYAMLNPMPLKIIKFHHDLSNVDLNNFFGFCLVKATCPIDIPIPLLPFRDKAGSLIFPTGTFTSVQFSEELKACLKHGYKFELISGYEFEKSELFNEYIDHFYDIKKNSVGSSRFIAKMHLNQLYGYFGRKLDVIETKVVDNEDLLYYFKTRLIESCIPVNDEKTLLLMGKNVNLDLIQKLNEEFQDFRLGIQDSFQHVKANVAIAAAVTSYARMTMIDYKTLPDVKVFYSDTDSMFIDKPLPSNFIGDELGLMKDELKGNVISKAYFLGIKQYGFKYVDKNSNQTITKSVFAGIKRDSLTFNDIEQLACGNTLSRNVDVRFYKSFKDLNITVINNVKIDIKQNCSKLLFKNRYIPVHLINNFGLYF